MKTKEIFYSVQNMGDGSAYPHWFESMALADIDQAYMDEGWGESCVGSIVVQGTGDFEFVNPVLTIYDVIKDTQEEMDCYETEESWYKTLKEKLKALEGLKG